MRFADPWYFTLILLLPIIFFAAKSSGGRLLYSNITNLKNLQRALQISPRLILLALRFLAITLAIMALARPQAGKTVSEVLSDGVDIYLILDTSGSMKAMDFKIEGKRVTRLDIVKKVVQEFIKKRPNDRMGLIVFGEDAYTQCPLTLDHGVLVDFVQKLEIGMAGEATAIGSAIGTAVKRMKDLKSKSKISILLTDGRNTAGQLPPLKAAELAKKYEIKVYTVGAGTRGKAPFLVETLFGKRFAYQNVPIDEPTLEEIANQTNASYFRATDTESLLAIYQEIDRLEKTEVKVKEYTEYDERFFVYLILALFVLGLEVILGNTRLRILP